MTEHPHAYVLRLRGIDHHAIQKIIDAQSFHPNRLIICERRNRDNQLLRATWKPAAHKKAGMPFTNLTLAMVNADRIIIKEVLFPVRR